MFDAQNKFISINQIILIRISISCNTTIFLIEDSSRVVAHFIEPREPAEDEAILRARLLLTRTVCHS